MASGDDKPHGEGSGDKARPSAKRSGTSGLESRTDPFDEEPSPKREANPKGEDAPPERKQRRRGASPEKDAAPIPEAPRSRRFGFRRRGRAADDRDAGDTGRRVASLARDELLHDDLDDDRDLADLPEPPRFRMPPWWALLGGLVLLLLVSSTLYGELNTERYFLVCSSSRAEPHRGRGFPWPFGHKRMVGAQYRPVALGGDAQCQTQELDSEAELRHALLKLLLVEAERLSHKSRSADLSGARRMVNQGALLAKNYKKARARLEALRATLDFGQARVVMRELETTLGEARRLFIKARSQSKQYRKESTAWIVLLDRMLGQLRRRVAGDPLPPKRVGAPSLPVGPGPMFPAVPPRRPVSGGATPDAMKPGSSTPPRRATPLPPPDAGVSGGGILL